MGPVEHSGSPNGLDGVHVLEFRDDPVGEGSDAFRRRFERFHLDELASIEGVLDGLKQSRRDTSSTYVHDRFQFVSEPTEVCALLRCEF